MHCGSNYFRQKPHLHMSLLRSILAVVWRQQNQVRGTTNITNTVVVEIAEITMKDHHQGIAGSTGIVMKGTWLNWYNCSSYWFETCSLFIIERKNVDQSLVRGLDLDQDPDRDPDRDRVPQARTRGIANLLDELAVRKDAKKKLVHGS